jgi:hypothetical protein
MLALLHLNKDPGNAYILTEYAYESTSERKKAYGAVWVAVGAVRQYAYAASAEVVVVAVGLGSRQRPNQPWLVHVVVVVAELVVVVVVSLVVWSLHPNQPGCVR